MSVFLDQGRRSAPGPRHDLKRVTEMGPQWIIKMRNHPARTMLCASFQKSRSRAFLATLAPGTPPAP